MELTKHQQDIKNEITRLRAIINIDSMLFVKSGELTDDDLAILIEAFEKKAYLEGVKAGAASVEAAIKHNKTK